MRDVFLSLSLSLSLSLIFHSLTILRLDFPPSGTPFLQIIEHLGTRFHRASVVSDGKELSVYINDGHDA